MQILENKIVTIAIAIFLMVSMSASTMLLPSASAHTPPWNLPTYAYIWASPNPVGEGQKVSVYLWLTNYYYGSAVTNNLAFNGFEFTLKAPDGTVTTQTFNNINPTSAQFTDFVPSQVGTYNLTFTFPGQVYTQSIPISLGPGLPVGPNPYTNDIFLPSNASTTVTVQTTQIPNALTGAPLPTAYWTRPIYGENTGWYSIASNWLGIGSPNYGGWMNTGGDALSGPFTGMAIFPGDAVGSQTSHVMWTKPLQSGGVVGGNDVGITADTYFDGSAYIIRYNNPIILDGMLYYTEPIGFTATGYWEPGGKYGPTDCVNLQTGQQIWSSTSVPALDFGYIQSVDTPNEHGVNPPILVSQVPQPFGSTWMLFDGDTGNWLSNITNVPVYTAPELGSPPSPWTQGSARAMGPDGNYLDYVFANLGTAANPNWNLAEWNSSLLFMPVAAEAPTFTGLINGGLGSDYDWNVSVPYLNTNAVPFVVVAANFGDGILCINGTMPSNGENELYYWDSSAPYTYFFVNLNASIGAVGSVLWSNTLQPPANNYTVVQGPVDWTTGVFMQDYKEAVQWVGYSLTTGKYLWTAKPQVALDYYGSTSEGTLPGAVAYGNLYSSAYGGIVYCYNDLTGTLLWTYGNGGTGNSTNAGLNYPYGDYPTQLQAIGNGIIYTVTSAHTWTSPIYKGAKQTAINATTGQEIWQISGITAEFGEMSYAMADGYNTWFNGYDNSIYVVGRGPSATTTAAQAFGTSVVIRGSVTDISAGAKQTQQAADFPNGVPVASDASMKDWMGYVYQQQPLPTNFTGVPVTISVLDSNNNFRKIGTAATDATGMYTLTWTPDIPGNYTVVANFVGTNGYWPSSAETSFAAISSPATPTPTATAQSNFATPTDVMTYIAVGVIAIIIAIAIVGILMLRKRP